MDEHDVVILLEDIESKGLVTDDCGVIVHVYNKNTFEVEFIKVETTILATLNASQIESV